MPSTQRPSLPIFRTTCWWILLVHFAAASAQTPASFKDDLIRQGYVSSVQRVSDSVIVTIGSKSGFIRAPQAQAEFCQRLLAHIRSSSAEVTRVVLSAPGEGVLGSCTGSGYQPGA